jgi:hypothetical protein
LAGETTDPSPKSPESVDATSAEEERANRTLGTDAVDYDLGRISASHARPSSSMISRPTAPRQ